MFNMLKVVRELFGQLVTAESSKLRPSTKRKTHRTLLRLEELEGRLVPAPLTTTWTDNTKNHLASDSRNWTAGLPNSTTQAILDGDTTQDDITFTQGVTCDGIVTKTSYSGKITIQAAVSSNATVEIQTGEPHLIVSNGNSLKLTNGAALQVDSGAGLYLDDNQAASTFVIGDGAAGEILRNSGSIAYLGTAGASLVDKINVPVLNNGAFSLEGGYYGTGSGALLEVHGTDLLTNNVSWYQNASGANTTIGTGATLEVDSGYTQTAGTLIALVSRGSTVSTLFAGTSNTNEQTININGGTVQVSSQGDETVYGELFLKAKNVYVGGEIDVRINGQEQTEADLIYTDHNIYFQTGAKFVVNPQGGSVTPGLDWGILLGGSLYNTNNLMFVGNGTKDKIYTTGLDVNSNP